MLISTEIFTGHFINLLITLNLFPPEAILKILLNRFLKYDLKHLTSFQNIILLKIKLNEIMNAKTDED